MAFIDGLLVTDHFYHEKKWEIGLKGFIPELSGREYGVDLSSTVQRSGDSYGFHPNTRIYQWKIPGH